jgi:hypothetical protein
MTKEEVRAYLQTYCNIDLKEEYCTLENVLNLIPNVQDSEQSEELINEHCFDSLAESNWLSGDLIVSRNNYGMWSLDWDFDGMVGVLPQGKDLMTAALSMCEFCVVNGIRLNIKNLKNNI